MTRLPESRERRLSQPAPSMTPTAAKLVKIAFMLPRHGDDPAEAAEQRCFEYHQIGEHAADCETPCPWCPPGGRWSA
jgi:hypothetical protein